MYTKYMQNSLFPLQNFYYNFAFLWSCSQSSKEKIIWKIVDNLLVTFVLTRRKRLYLRCLPFGTATPDQLLEVLYKSMRFCFEYNGHSRANTIVKVITSPELEFLQSSSKFSSYFMTKTLKGIERIYSLPKLCSLAGGEYANLRNHINRFYRKNSQITIRPYITKDYKKLLRLKEEWNSTRGEKYHSITDDIRYRVVLRYHTLLHHTIFVAEAGDKIVGMATSGLTPDHQSWGYFLKVLDGYNGLSEALIIHVAKELIKRNPNMQLMNVGHDSGIKGLINFKTKFHPVLNLERYRIYLQ